MSGFMLYMFFCSDCINLYFEQRRTQKVGILYLCFFLLVSFFLSLYMYVCLKWEENEYIFIYPSSKLSRIFSKLSRQFMSA